MTVSKGAESLRQLFPDGVFPSGCPSRVLLDHVTSKWGVLILISLTDGSHRWSELPGCDTPSRRRTEQASPADVNVASTQTSFHFGSS